MCQRLHRPLCVHPVECGVQHPVAVALAGVLTLINHAPKP